MCNISKNAQFLPIFRGIARSKLCGKSKFSKSFYAKKLGESMVFYAVHLKVMTQNITSEIQDL